MLTFDAVVEAFWKQVLVRGYLLLWGAFTNFCEVLRESWLAPRVKANSSIAQENQGVL